MVSLGRKPKTPKSQNQTLIRDAFESLDLDPKRKMKRDLTSRKPHASLQASSDPKHSKHRSERSGLRKKVDPVTAKYFMEISNHLSDVDLDLDERASLCATALVETRGKELELATDFVISRTLQNLIEGCDLDQVCGFLRGCIGDFASIAVDKFGSHVLETTLKTLVMHRDEEERLPSIESVLTAICQVVAVDAVNVMCNSYGSHVVRSILCICKGIPLNALEDFHVTKTKSALLAERLNNKLPQLGENAHNVSHPGFPSLLKLFIGELLKNADAEISSLRVNKYSSFILQTSLKLLVGEDQDLLHAILTILGCSSGTASQGFLESCTTQEIIDLLKDTASSHLIEVILEVAPENLYSEILVKVFKGSLYEISCHQCGNFVVQALLSSARCKGHVDMIWEELGQKIKELLSSGKAGVVTSLLAACQRLKTHDFECSEVLAGAVCSDHEPPHCIVPNLLFLDSYLSCKEKSSWQWPTGDRMHVLGCLMLQTVFRCPNRCVKKYIDSMMSIESDHFLEMAKDSAGSRVLESFLSSDISAKRKNQAIAKLLSHFGELSLNACGSFTVEKCFSAGNLSLREAIVSELSSVRETLSKTKHGAYVMKKLDLEGYTRSPEQWKSRQTMKETVRKDFQSTFASNNCSQDVSPSAGKPSQRNKKKKGTGEKATQKPHQASVENSGAGCFLRQQGKRKFSAGADGKATKKPHQASVGSSGADCFLRQQGKRKFTAGSDGRAPQQRKSTTKGSAKDSFVRLEKRKFPSSELADLAGKQALSLGEKEKLFRGSLDKINQLSNKKTRFVENR